MIKNYRDNIDTLSELNDFLKLDINETSYEEKVEEVDAKRIKKSTNPKLKAYISILIALNHAKYLLPGVAVISLSLHFQDYLGVTISCIAAFIAFIFSIGKNIEFVKELSTYHFSHQSIKMKINVFLGVLLMFILSSSETGIYVTSFFLLITSVLNLILAFNKDLFKDSDFVYSINGFHIQSSKISSDLNIEIGQRYLPNKLINKLTFGRKISIEDREILKHKQKWLDLKRKENGL